MRGFSQSWDHWDTCKCYQIIIVFVILFLIIIINNMLLSLLWDKIVADDMMMLSVKVMKLLIWNVLLKLNSKSYHVVKEKRIIYDAILKTQISKVKFRFLFNFPQYSNSCEEYCSGEEFKVGTFLSTVPIQKNSWIDQIWTKFATGSEMVFFSPCIIYKSKVSSLKNVRAVGHACFGHSFLLCTLLRGHLRLWLATWMILAHCVRWTPFLLEHDLISFSQ